MKAMVYLLAAGKGRRAGGPKAWKLHEGTSLLERQVGFLLHLFDSGSVAVTMQAGWKDRCNDLSSLVRWVPVDPEATPLGALQALCKGGRHGAWAFLYHVDMPLWEEGLFTALAGRIPDAEKDRRDAIVPSRGGKRGHPVLLSPKALAALAALDPAIDRLDHGLKTREVMIVEVESPRIHENWNE